MASSEPHDPRPPAGFLGEPADGDAAARMYDEDRDGVGYVMNLTRVWAHDPGVHEAFSALAATAAERGGLSLRQRGVLVTATASTLGDSYCSLAWGQKLAAEAGDDVAAAVLSGADDRLDPADRALAAWARRVVRDPSGTSPEDLQQLRAAGLGDRQIFCLTVYVATRVAFSTVNAALGAHPDRRMAEQVPDAVRRVVRWGRPVAAAPSLQ